jgi:anthranilate/para-aminobenzoate synthase component I
MKQFFSRSLDWASPLEIFSFFREKNTHKLHNAHLFFSGTAEKEENTPDRFSFIVFHPEKVTEKNIKTITEWKKLQDDFFCQKKNNTKNSEIVKKNWEFPFCGGIAGVFSYDFLRVFTPISHNKNSSPSSPLSAVDFYETFFAFDHQKKKCVLAGWFSNQHTADIFFDRFSPHLSSSNFLEHIPQIFLEKNFMPEISKEQYQKHFQNCQEEIEKGSSFQINFSQKFSATLQKETSAWDIFVSATQKNPAPMMYFREDEEFSLISCSPERLFSCDRNNVIFTQPIAGTRPRGKNFLEETQFENELIHSIKEQSEHTMLVDLLRNDFGKVAKFGSVKVVHFGRIEKYATVMHLVSDIVGEIDTEKSGKNIFDVFEAVFPGGTITGAPKIETMKILAREEVSSRNYYCGSAGYFSICGSSDWNILIRTLEKNGSEISGRAGGGLVWGANPNDEYQETLHKFSGMQKIFDKTV